MGGGLWFWAKEVLVGSGGLGVSRIFPENLPPQALHSPPSPLFLPLTLSFNPSTPQTPPSNSLAQAFTALTTLLPSFFSSNFFLPPQCPLLDPLRTPSEFLIGSPQKAQKQPFLGLFRGTPKTPKKGLKTPFLTPFSPLPYPL